MKTTPITVDALVPQEANSDFVRTIMACPTPAAGEVLVRVKASSVNPLDLKIRSGQAPHARHPLPAILGMDVAGVVEAVGSGVTAFKPQDEVFGMTGGVGGLQGSLATFVSVDADLLAPKPKNLTMRKAAEASDMNAKTSMLQIPRQSAPNSDK